MKQIFDSKTIFKISVYYTVNSRNGRRNGHQIYVFYFFNFFQSSELYMVDIFGLFRRNKMIQKSNVQLYSVKLRLLVYYLISLLKKIGLLKILWLVKHKVYLCGNENGLYDFKPSQSGLKPFWWF